MQEPNNLAPDRESLRMAYELAVKSYEWMLKRADIWDGNLDKVLTLGTTVNAGVVAIAINVLKNEKTAIVFSFYFWAALIITLLGVATGFLGKFKGEIVLSSPQALYEDWLILRAEDFQKYFIEYAGKHWSKNKAYVHTKSVFTLSTTLLFMVSATLYVLWAMNP